MTYSETLEYLFEQLPMFQRVGPAAYKANLNNTITIMELLEHPEKDFRSIHIAGTNGKGSISHMLAAVLQQSGYKTGLYTSPHLKDFRERIRIDGKMIEKTEVVKFVNKYRFDFEKIKPSFFEWTVGLAFDYFSRKNVDIAVIETGMGGRLDSTNVITPLVSVISNIHLDHTDLLGNTIQKIAKEKAGIIKENVPVVIGNSQTETTALFKKTAQENCSEIYFADKIYGCKLIENDATLGSLLLNAYKNKELYIKELKIDLGGLYQLQNIPAVLQTSELLEQRGFNLHRKNIKRGLANIKKQTGLLGRWQILHKEPLIICDTGHNINGLTESMSQLKKLNYRKLHLVIGMVNDKDIDKMLQLFPKKASYYFCCPDIPRGLNANTLRTQAQEHNLKGKTYKSVWLAYEQAKNEAWKDDVIFIGGSSFVVAEVV